jgi:hypothetical protein
MADWAAAPTIKDRQKPAVHSVKFRYTIQPPADPALLDTRVFERPTANAPIGNFANAQCGLPDGKQAARTPGGLHIQSTDLIQPIWLRG